MTTIDLLLHAPEHPPQGPALRAALALAKRLPARLDALYVADLPAAAFSLPEAVPVQLDETRRRCLDASAYADAWRDQLATQGVQGQWRVGQGDTVQTLCAAAAGYALLVMERSQQRSDTPVGFGLVSRTVFGSRRPVLVVPDTARPESLGERVVVAWSGSRESTLALNAALPLLRRADEVFVLDGSDDQQPATLPPPGLADWLSRHAVQARIERLADAAETGAGQRLLQAAHDIRADLVVMGAWGRSRLSELVLGGTTRYMFMHADLPMLVAN